MIENRGTRENNEENFVKFVALSHFAPGILIYIVKPVLRMVSIN